MQAAAHGEPAQQAAGVDPAQLLQLIGSELQAEDTRPAEAPLGFFNDFQDIVDLGCYDRLVFLANETLALQQQLASYHDNMHGVVGLFWLLLQQMPEESSWVWLLLNSRERLVRKIRHYISQVVVLALDQPTCIADVRRTLLDATVQWKKLQADGSVLMWNSFAFGVYGDIASLRAAAVGTEWPGHSVRHSWSEMLVAGIGWLSEVRGWYDSHSQSLFQAMAAAAPQLLEGEGGSHENRFHHQDEQGMFVPYEYLRRKAFGQWALDKGLLRGLLRHVWQPSYEEGLSLGDFGAGGGQYSAWLNETGLMTAVAFDGTEQATEISGGVVMEINLIEDLRLWRTFDWVLCLEVGEHIPKQYSGILLRNLRRHARQGLIMSWSDDWEGIGHVNCLQRADFVALVERETDLRLDPLATELVARACDIDYIGRTVAVFRAASAAA